jgi:gluconate 2-dehydrogenase gamma chain
MLGDPIYGGNKNNNGWQAINHNTGLPQPKEKYGI